MSYDVNDGDLVLCVDDSPNHVTGEPVPLVKGETYAVWGVGFTFDQGHRLAGHVVRGKVKPMPCGACLSSCVPAGVAMHC